MSGILSRVNVEASLLMFSTLFGLKLKNTPVIYDRLATVMPGVSEQVEFNWLGSAPVMKRWVGDRHISKVRAEKHTLRTEWWANGIESETEDSKISQLAVRIGQLATYASRRIDAEVVEMYKAGFGATRGLTYDGQPLFDTDHTASGAGGTAQSNLQVGALTSANFNAAIQKGLALVDDNDEPIVVDHNLLLAGGANQLKARELLEKKTLAGGEENIDNARMGYIITPRITGNEWFLLATNELMSVILGIEREAEFVSVNGPDSLEKFMRRRELFGAHAKFGTCYGFWQSAIGSQG